MESGHPRLKAALFRRDGWQDNGQWMAHCAFGCGTVISGKAATIDRYPIPGCAGGAYHIDNTRLACEPCNGAAGNHGYPGPSVFEGMSNRQRRTFEKAQRRGRHAVITPQMIFGPDYTPAGITCAEKVARHNAEQAKKGNKSKSAKKLAGLDVEGRYNGHGIKMDFL